METHKPKTIEEAINNLQEFFECDLYSKFKPEKEINGDVWVRQDSFKNEKEFYEYLDDHFSILKEQIKTLTKAKSSLNRD